MDNELNDFVEESQQKTFDETRVAYGEIAFRRWQNFSYIGGLSEEEQHCAFIV